MMWRNEDGRKWLFNSAGGGESCNVTARVERAPLCPDPRFSSSSWYRRTCVTMMFQIKRHVTRLLLLPDDAARTNQKEGNELSRRPSICDDDPRYRRKIRDLFVQMHKREWLPVLVVSSFLAYWYQQQRQRIISHAIRVFFGAHSGTMTGAYPGIKAAMLRITHY